MRNLYLLVVSIMMFTVSCKKEASIATIETEGQPTLVCGMDEATANITPELRGEIFKRARMATGPAQALLLFLDFDGAFIRRGSPNYSSFEIVSSPFISFNSICPPARLTDEQKLLIIQLVADDFSPFNIKITTSQEEYNNYNPRNRHMCIVTSVPSVIGMSNSVAGVSSWYGPGVRSGSDPTFAFADLFGNSDKKEVADVISHEVGHNLGLDHQNRFNEFDCSRISEYHPGFGNGALSFAPLMGNGFRKRISNWFVQACQTQNDFTFLNNQVALKEDDFPNEFGGRTPAPAGTTGVLEMAGDLDFLYISPHSPRPVYITSDNIDLKVTVYNMAGKVVSVHDDTDDINISIPELKGVCYLKVEAVSNINMSAQFMTGEYKVSY